MEESSSSLSSFVETKLPKTTQWITTIGLFAYIVGFAITNAYLGSLGAVTFDLFRARYVAAGLLYLLFIGIIVFLVKNTRDLYLDTEDSPLFTRIRKLIFSSVWYLIILYFFVIPALAVFSGSAWKFSSNVRVSNLLTFLINKVPSLLYTSLVLVAIVFLLLLIVFLVVLTINPKDKDGKRFGRKRMIRDALHALKDPKKLLISVFPIVIFYLIWSLASYTLAFFGTPVDFLVPNINDVYNDEGWSRLFVTILGIYVLISIYFIQSAYSWRSVYSESTPPPSRSTQVSSWTIILLGCLIFATIFYGRVVYPYIPQQVGGGKLIPIVIEVNDDVLRQKIYGSSSKVYLLDRTANSALIITTDQLNQSRVIEIASSDISGIFYEVVTSTHSFSTTLALTSTVSPGVIPTP